MPATARRSRCSSSKPAYILTRPIACLTTPRLAFPRCIRSTDLGGILGVGRVGVLLPHQDVAAADVAKQRVMERLDRQGPAGVRWDARLLCYPGDGAEISNLLTTGCEPDRGHSQRVEDLGKLA